VATFGAGTAMMGTELIATTASGALSSAVAGQAAIATENVLSGREVTEKIGDPTDSATDAVIGGTLSGVGYVVERVTISSLAKISTHNPDAEYVVVSLLSVVDTFRGHMKLIDTLNTRLHCYTPLEMW